MYSATPEFWGMKFNLSRKKKLPVSSVIDHRKCMSLTYSKINYLCIVHSPCYFLHKKLIIKACIILKYIYIYTESQLMATFFKLIKR